MKKTAIVFLILLFTSTAFAFPPTPPAPPAPQSLGTTDSPTFAGVTAPLIETVIAATGNVAVATAKGGLINNYGQTNDAVLTLPAAAAGYNFTAILGTTVAKYFRLDPNASDSIYLDGVTTGDGKYIGVASAAIGNAVSCITFKTGATAYDWFCATVYGAWTAE